jgi:hypothetical protein
MRKAIVRDIMPTTEKRKTTSSKLMTSDENTLKTLGFTRFWTLSILRNYRKHKTTQRFGNWICFRPQRSGWEECTLLIPFQLRPMTEVSSNGPNRAPFRIRHLFQNNDVTNMSTQIITSCRNSTQGMQENVKKKKKQHRQLMQLPLNYFFIIIWFVRLLALRPLLAYCASLGWQWRRLWRSRWNVDWQGKPKFSEKTCPIRWTNT